MGGTRGVVLTGLGLLTPLGADRESSWDALIDGKSAVSFDGGRVPLRPEGGTRAIQLALAAAREAWAHACLLYTSFFLFRG